MIIKSYAKINIALNVIGKKDEKMHEIDMVMLPLELHDSLEMSELKTNKDNFVTFADYSLGGFDYNLATIAIEKLLAYTKKNNKFRIVINKNIPISAGLGGGSSNAAAAMLGVIEMLKLKISNEELNNLAFEIGSDVPFFLKNVSARVRGIGEIVEPIEVKNSYYVLIVKPSTGLSTEKVYIKSDEYKLDVTDIDQVVDALKNGDDEKLEKYMANSLEKPAIDLLPEIQTIKDKLRKIGCKMVLMSGSGSSVFAISQDKKILQKACQLLENDFEVELTKVLKGDMK